MLIDMACRACLFDFLVRMFGFWSDPGLLGTEGREPEEDEGRGGGRKDDEEVGVRDGD